MPNDDATRAAEKSAPALPPFIVLLDERGELHAGHVMAADADLLSALDAEGCKYRAASDFERRLGGFVD